MSRKQKSKKRFKICKKFVRGDRKGKRVTEFINIKDKDSIHGFLWDMTELFDKNKCNFIIEWYTYK